MVLVEMEYWLPVLEGSVPNRPGSQRDGGGNTKKTGRGGRGRDGQLWSCVGQIIRGTAGLHMLDLS